MTRRILHILGSLNTGGAENLVLDLLACSTGEGHKTIEFHLVYMHSSNPHRQSLFEGLLGSRLKYIPCGKGSAATFRFIGALRNYITNHKIEEIHCHNNVDAYWAYIASVFTGVKKITLSVHGLNLDFCFLTKKSALLSSFERKILGAIEIKYVSGVTRDFYLQKHGWKELDGEIVHNGIDWSKFGFCKDSKPSGVSVSNEDLEDGMKPWMSGSKPLFLMVGNFNTPVRLQNLLCKAMAGMKGELPFRFLFVGERNAQLPNLYDNCVQICKDAGLLDTDVFFLGRRDDVPALMALTDGYIYASQGDTFGISVVEAAGAGLPVICSRIPAFVEVLQDGKYGTLVENSEESFVRAMVSLASVVRGNSSKKETAQEIREIYSVQQCFRKYYGD